MRLVERAVSRRTDPVDASFRIADGAPVVVPARPGVRFGPAAVADAFLAAARSEGDERRRSVATRSEPAALTTRDARGLGVTARVATSTTRYPRSDAIDAGVTEAAGMLDGTLLEPGESLSFDAVVGDGLDADAASQVASTLFDAAYLAGLDDVESVAHPTWLARFPEGRDAAVGPGVGDLRLRNDTRHGVFVTACGHAERAIRAGEVTVSLWSTQVWDIDLQTSPRTRRATAAPRPCCTDPSCTPSRRGSGLRRRRHPDLPPRRGVGGRPHRRADHLLRPGRPGRVPLTAHLGRRDVDRVAHDRGEEVAVVVVGRLVGLGAPVGVGGADAQLVGAVPLGGPDRLPAGPRRGLVGAGQGGGPPGARRRRCSPRPRRSPRRPTRPARAARPVGRPRGTRPATPSTSATSSTLLTGIRPSSASAPLQPLPCIRYHRVFHGESSTRVVTRSSPSHLMLAMPTQPGTTRRAGNPWSRGQRRVVHVERDQHVVERLRERQRPPHPPVVDAVHDVRRVEPDRRHADGLRAQAGVAEQGAQRHPAPPGDADRAVAPLGPGPRRALLGVEQAAPVAGALQRALVRRAGEARAGRRASR